MFYLPAHVCNVISIWTYRCAFESELEITSSVEQLTLVDVFMMGLSVLKGFYTK